MDFWQLINSFYISCGHLLLSSYTIFIAITYNKLCNCIQNHCSFLMFEICKVYACQIISPKQLRDKHSSYRPQLQNKKIRRKVTINHRINSTIQHLYNDSYAQLSGVNAILATHPIYTTHMQRVHVQLYTKRNSSSIHYPTGYSNLHRFFLRASILGFSFLPQTW